MTSWKTYSWSEWRCFPDPQKGQYLYAPFGGGVYRLRNKATKEYVLFGKIKRILYYFGTNEIPRWLYDIMQEGIHDHPFGPYDISEINTNFIIQEILKFRHRLPYNE